MKIAKRMSYAAFGVFDGTEINDRFMEGGAHDHSTVRSSIIKKWIKHELIFT